MCWRIACKMYSSIMINIDEIDKMVYLVLINRKPLIGAYEFIKGILKCALRPIYYMEANVWISASVSWFGGAVRWHCRRVNRELGQDNDGMWCNFCTSNTCAKTCPPSEYSKRTKHTSSLYPRTHQPLCRRYYLRRAFRDNQIIIEEIIELKIVPSLSVCQKCRNVRLGFRHDDSSTSQRVCLTRRRHYHRHRNHIVLSALLQMVIWMNWKREPSALWSKVLELWCGYYRVSRIWAMRLSLRCSYYIFAKPTTAVNLWGRIKWWGSWWWLCSLGELMGGVRRGWCYVALIRAKDLVLIQIWLLMCTNTFQQ